MECNILRYKHFRHVLRHNENGMKEDSVSHIINYGLNFTRARCSNLLSDGVSNKIAINGEYL